MICRIRFVSPKGWTPRWVRLLGSRWGIVVMTSLAHWMVGVEGLNPGVGVAIGPLYVGIGVCEDVPPFRMAEEV